MPIVTLTTDFGSRDHYVAAMKGVILSAAPKATLVDVSHELPRGGIIPAAFVLAQLPKTFPAGTVHLAVVDPTVGSDRAILAARASGQYFVGPDNGLFTFVAQEWGIEALHQVTPPPAESISRTFHGRDIMAPAAAMLAGRGRLEQLGPATDQMELLAIAEPEKSHAGLVGRVIHVDHFGNCTTNIEQAVVREMVERAPGLAVSAGGQRVGGLVNTYADVEPDGLCALIGSAGLLEVAVYLGSAADRLGLQIGSEVELRYE